MKRKRIKKKEEQILMYNGMKKNIKKKGQRKASRKKR